MRRILTVDISEFSSKIGYPASKVEKVLDDYIEEVEKFIEEYELISVPYGTVLAFRLYMHKLISAATSIHKVKTGKMKPETNVRKEKILKLYPKIISLVKDAFEKSSYPYNKITYRPNKSTYQNVSYLLNEGVLDPKVKEKMQHKVNSILKYDTERFIAKGKRGVERFKDPREQVTTPFIRI